MWGQVIVKVLSKHHLYRWPSTFRTLAILKKRIVANSRLADPLNKERLSCHRQALGSFWSAGKWKARSQGQYYSSTRSFVSLNPRLFGTPGISVSPVRECATLKCSPQHHNMPHRKKFWSVTELSIRNETIRLHQLSYRCSQVAQSLQNCYHSDSSSQGMRHFEMFTTTRWIGKSLVFAAELSICNGPIQLHKL